MPHVNDEYPYKHRQETTVVTAQKMGPTKLAVTPWFSPGTKPTRLGIYQRRSGARRPTIMYSFWNGYFWGLLSGTIQDAVANKFVLSAMQRMEWRGIL